MNPTEKLAETVESFCHFIEELPREMLVEQDWGPKEVLAHLLFYHEGYGQEIEAQLADKPFDLPQGRFRDLNAQAAAASRGIPIDELLRRFRAADERLRRWYQTHNPETLPIEIKQGGKTWTLAELVPAIERHVGNHHRQLQQQEH